jgi:hypothetical protein
LYYEQPTKNDSGYYFCVASNVHGQVESKKAKVWVLDMSPGQPRLAAIINVTKTCKTQNTALQCVRKNMSDSTELQHFSKALGATLNSFTSKVTNISYVSNGLRNATVSFLYTSSKPEIEDVNEPVFDPILESFARKRKQLVNGLKALHQEIKNGSFNVSNTDEEIIGDPGSFIAWVVPPGCPIGQGPHSNGYMCGK